MHARYKNVMLTLPPRHISSGNNIRETKNQNAKQCRNNFSQGPKCGPSVIILPRVIANNKRSWKSLPYWCHFSCCILAVGRHGQIGAYIFWKDCRSISVHSRPKSKALRLLWCVYGCILPPLLMKEANPNVCKWSQCVVTVFCVQYCTPQPNVMQCYSPKDHSEPPPLVGAVT